MATNTHERERTLTREVSNRVERSLPGVEVLAVELTGPDRFCVFVDHPEGVTHALCERVTDALRDLLHEYTIDVSSPGLERPLRRAEHFRAVLGKNVAVRTSTNLNGRKKFRGELIDAGDRTVTVSQDGDAVNIPYDSIVRGNLIEEARVR